MRDPRPPVVLPRWLPRWRVALSVVALSIGAYLGILHPWLMNWGAVPIEIAARLPGDELEPRPVTWFTRAITIEAPPAEVWPWIVQMGQDRAGFYSNTWLENLIAADIHNADAIHPEWQRRSIGDVVPLANQARFGGLPSRTAIVALEPERMIANIPGRFVLVPLDSERTRLLVRESLESQGPLLTRLLAWDALHFVMVQRMMRGIKERAEEQPLVPTPIEWAARAGWGLAALAVAALLWRRSARLGRAALALPALPALAIVFLTRDLDAALAAFLAIGITVAGVLAFGRRWWPAQVVLGVAVLLALVLAPDAHAVLGLAFLATATAALTSPAARPATRRELVSA